MWRRVYRALEHRQAKTRCEKVPTGFPEEMDKFGQTFADMQSKRHLADYDPDHPFKKSEVIADINDVRTAIDGFLATPANVRRDFAIHVLMKMRTDA